MHVLNSTIEETRRRSGAVGFGVHQQLLSGFIWHVDLARCTGFDVCFYDAIPYSSEALLVHFIFAAFLAVMFKPVVCLPVAFGLKDELENLETVVLSEEGNEGAECIRDGGCIVQDLVKLRAQVVKCFRLRFHGIW